MAMFLCNAGSGDSDFNFFKDVKSLMTNGKWETQEALDSLDDLISMFSTYYNLGALCSHDQHIFSVPTSYDVNYITGYSYNGNNGIAFSTDPFTLNNNGQITFPSTRHYFAVNSQGAMTDLMLNKGTTKNTNYSTSSVTMYPEALSTSNNNIFYTSYDIQSPDHKYVIKKNMSLSDISIIRG